MLALGPESLFAHRGLHDTERRRNSLSAIVAAADAGYGIELDLRLTADGVPVVSHDPDTLHDTGIALDISSSTAADVLALEFSGTHERLASFDDVLAHVAPHVPLLVELKPTRRVGAIVHATAARLAGREDSAAVQSFHPAIVREARRSHPRFAAGQLVARPAPGMSALERAHSRTLLTNLAVRPHFLAAEVTMLDDAVVRRWRRSGRPLLGWTVTTPDAVRACRAAGAGMIFEDFRP